MKRLTRAKDARVHGVARGRRAPLTLRGHLMARGRRRRMQIGKPSVTSGDDVSHRRSRIVTCKNATTYRLASKFAGALLAHSARILRTCVLNERTI